MNKVQHIVVLAVCLWLCGSASSSLLFGSATPAVEEPFIGWAGETYDPAEVCGTACYQFLTLRALLVSSV